MSKQNNTKKRTEREATVSGLRRTAAPVTCLCRQHSPQSINNHLTTAKPSRKVWPTATLLPATSSTLSPAPRPPVSPAASLSSPVPHRFLPPQPILHPPSTPPQTRTDVLRSGLLPPHHPSHRSAPSLPRSLLLLSTSLVSSQLGASASTLDPGTPSAGWNVSGPRWKYSLSCGGGRGRTGGDNIMSRCC